MGKVAAANISRAEIVITGSGITGEMKQQLTISGNTITGTVIGIPAGSDRRFTLNGYNASGALTYTGSTTATITAGQPAIVRIPVKKVGAAPTGTPRLQIGDTATAIRGYGNNSELTSITLAITNAGTADATGVRIKFMAQGNGGGPVDDAEVNIGTVKAGDRRLLQDLDVIFSGTSEWSFEANYVTSAEFTLTYNEGDPIAGTITVR